jgi:Trk K+ transport system NAD-binding subunit
MEHRARAVPDGAGDYDGRIAAPCDARRPGLHRPAANQRQRFGIIVGGIQRRDMPMAFNPEPDAMIGGGDVLVVLGRHESLKRLETEAGGHG